jgi:hypothetical protein
MIIRDRIPTSMAWLPCPDIAATMPVSKTRALRRALLVNSVDVMGARRFLVSSAHDEKVIDRTVAAFSQFRQDLKAESAIPTNPISHSPFMTSV